MAREGTFCDRLAHLMSLFMLVRLAGLRQDRKCSVFSAGPAQSDHTRSFTHFSCPSEIIIIYLYIVIIYI